MIQNAGRLVIGRFEIMKTRWIALCVAYALMIGGGWALGHWLSQWSGAQPGAIDAFEIRNMVAMISAAYVVASALPFVPGAEIGMALIVVLGGKIALVVYGCTVLALSIAYSVGRFVPTATVAAGFGYVGLAKTQDFVLRIDGLSAAERVAMMISHAPNRLVPFLLRYRYLALAVALNLPGNTLAGGGGGLSLLAGMSGLFPPVPFLLTILIAVAPFPLLILLAGYQP